MLLQPPPGESLSLLKPVINGEEVTALSNADIKKPHEKHKITMKHDTTKGQNNSPVTEFKEMEI